MEQIKRKTQQKGARFHFFDELRGFVLVCLIFYHAFFDLGFIFDSPLGMKLFNFFEPFQPPFAGIFILLCGISCNLSRNNLKRGLILALFAVLITVFSFIFIPGEPIYFGILHLLSGSILLYALFAPFVQKIRPFLGIGLSVILATLTFPIEQGYLGVKGIFEISLPQSLYQNNNFVVFGITSPSFSSADYFPLFPWIFIFFTGVFFGVFAKQGTLPRFFSTSHLPFLSFLGRNTLMIYILHQPVIYGILWLLYKLF